MVGDIGQTSHLHFYMFSFYVHIPASILTIGYVRYYTIVAYALCVIVTLCQYAYGTIL